VNASDEELTGYAVGASDLLKSKSGSGFIGTRVE